MKALAVTCWVAAWCCAGLIPAAFFAARDGHVRTARIELATGVLGAGGLFWTGVALW